jgi:hypothetical protein
MSGRKRKQSQDWDVDFGLFMPGEPEWEAAWAHLAVVTGDIDKEAYNDESGEAWSYLCSFKRKVRGAKWEHEFRHRDHPKKKKRWLLHLPASPGWRPAPVKRH